MNGLAIGSTDGRFNLDVVVVDDYRELTTEIAEALRRRGLSTKVAYDGATAVALAEDSTPAVALVDCALPDVDGFNLIRRLGKAWPETTFLVISGDVGGISEDLARQLRVHAFLNKPLPMRVLAQAVERLVHTSRDRAVEQEAPRAWISLGIGSPACRAPAMILEASPKSAKTESWPRSSEPEGATVTFAT